MKSQNKNYYLSGKIIALCFISFNINCQDVSTDTNVPIINNPSQANRAIVKPVVTPKPVISPSKSPEQPDDNEIVGTDTETKKSNINWKEYYPVIKGKKYSYLSTDSSTKIPVEILLEITDVQDKTFKQKQTILSASSSANFPPSEKEMTLNNDYSPQGIIPPEKVGGEKVTSDKQVEIIETPEKVKVPYKELDAIKVIVKSGDITITYWFAKNIGLVKSINVSKTETNTLELKDYK